MSEELEKEEQEKTESKTEKDSFFMNSIDHDEIFVQYYHNGVCQNPCKECGNFYHRIFDEADTEEKPNLPAHPNCDCEFKDIEIKKIGTISTVKGVFDSPEFWLVAFGRLPSYYITKYEAITQFGWKLGKDLNLKASGKMIGGDVYYNKLKLLPHIESREWRECDIDYVSGKRGAKRLFYSNDGLMFFSPDHGVKIFYQVKGDKVDENSD